MPRPRLRALAARHGILDSYLDQAGREERFTSDATRAALLAALGIDAGDEAAAGRVLDALEHEERLRVLEPVQVWREYAHAQPTLRLRLPEDAGAGVDWELELLCESGRRARAQGCLRHQPAGSVIEIEAPGGPLEPGYHRLVLRLDLRDGVRELEQLLVLAPRTCFGCSEALGERRAFGLWTNLYAVRSARDWGVGDLTDLGGLLQLCAESGAAFLGVNPLHALRNRGSDISPYGPVTRLFRNLVYLDVEAVPELADCDAARALLRSPALRERLARLRAAPQVDYAGVLAAKLPVLEELHRSFFERHRERATPRGAAYARYCAAEGELLQDFATYLAIESWRAQRGEAAADWRAWPAAFRDPRSPALAAFRREHARAVDLQAWLQFELDRQLAAAAGEARSRGLPIGVYQDLAVGSARDGFDSWAHPGVFVDGASIGAPPDDYSPTGQDWGLPPLAPARLRADGYRYWIRLLRAAFAHSGALRIDHVMGLFRLFWIPQGRPGSEGAYVRYPADDLLGILALESRRARAIVVGEDLGTVPPEVPPRLADWGILSSRVLYFERFEGEFHPSTNYPPRALVTANTHDLAPLAGWLQGRDLVLRREASQLASDEELALALEQRREECEALLRRLRQEGCLDAAAAPQDTAAICAAVNAFLCRTAAMLVGVSLDDLAGEVEPVNLPGVPVERHPNWSRRMQQALESLATDPALRRALAGIPAERATLRGTPAEERRVGTEATR